MTSTGPTTEDVAAFVGPNWESHYKRAWEKGGVTWNWPAALVSIPWLAYRRHPLLALGLSVVWVLFAIVPETLILVPPASFALFGVLGEPKASSSLVRHDSRQRLASIRRPA